MGQKFSKKNKNKKGADKGSSSSKTSSNDEQKVEQKEQSANQTGPKVLMLLGDYVEDYEVMVPYQTLLAAGYQVFTVCPDKQSGDKILTSIHDFEGDQTYTEKPGHAFELNYAFADAAKDPSQFAGVIVPGGRSTEYLSAKKEVVDLLSYFTSNDLPIAAICHGPLLLGAIDGYLKGKKATSYPACKPVLDLAGADFQPAEPVTTCFTDGRLVTGAAWPAHPQFCAQFMDVLGAKIKHSRKEGKRRVLVIAGDYVEDYEMMCVFQMLQAFGIGADVVCPGKAKGEKILTCVHDFEGDQTYTEKPGHNFELNATFADVKAKDYAALYIPGGRCSEYLSVDEQVLEMVRHFAKEKKVISQICHGVLVLAAAKVLEGRETAAYPACAPVVRLAKASFVKSEPVTQAHTQKVKGAYTLISGAAWPGNAQLVAQLIKELGVSVEIGA